MGGLDLTIECRVSVVGVALAGHCDDAGAIRAGRRNWGVLRGASARCCVAGLQRGAIWVRLESQHDATGVDPAKNLSPEPVLRLHRGAARREHGSETLVCVPAMIRLGSHIRLTWPEAERLFRLTDIEPVNIHTPADLDAYVARCKAHYWGRSRDTQFLHWLIDQERARLEVAA